MSQTKREQVISHIRYLREELREMHLGIKEDDLFPEPGELRGLMACLLYTSPSPRDLARSRMPSSA